VSSHFVQASRFVPVDPERAFDALLVAPLPGIFDRRYLALPPIREVRGPDAVWGTVGQTRTISTTDGGRLLETLTTVDRPHRFGYVLTDVHGPMRPLVRRVEGVWSVSPENGGSRIGWAWTLYPTVAPARLLIPLLARMWRGYAHLALERVEQILVA
jgi:Polyketide cyclase / dehydrase and lipid transport